jgi:hypothetical protein
MRSWTRIARIACIGALALLVGGCGVLSSREPLILHSDIPSEPLAGSYDGFAAIDAPTKRKLQRAHPAACIDPGYTAEKQDRSGRKTGKRERVFYCGYDPDGEMALPLFRFENDADGFLWFGEDNKSANLRLRRIHPGLYLGQLDDSNADTPRFLYMLFRMKPPGPEIFLLSCDEFSSVAEPVPMTAPILDSKIVGTDKPDREIPLRVALEEPAKECPITALESVQPELDAFIAQVDAGLAPPILILQRTGN